MERLDRQPDAHDFADRQAPDVVDEEMVVTDAHAVAPDPARIGSLGDAAAQQELVLGRRIRSMQPRRFAAEMCDDGTLALQASEARRGGKSERAVIRPL